MKTCRACGCYIPDLWGVCPGCGAIEAQKSDSVGRSAPERKDDRGGGGGQAILHFQDSRPRTVIKYGDNDMEDLDNLDHIESMDPYISLKLFGSELAEITRPQKMPTVFTR